MKLTLDMDVLTLGDLVDFEEAVGQSLMTAIDHMQSGELGLVPMVHLVHIFGRAADPGFTFDDARRVRLSDLEWDVAEPDPTDGGD